MGNKETSHTMQYQDDRSFMIFGCKITSTVNNAYATMKQWLLT